MCRSMVGHYKNSFWFPFSDLQWTTAGGVQWNYPPAIQATKESLQLNGISRAGISKAQDQLPE